MAEAVGNEPWPNNQDHIGEEEEEARQDEEREESGEVTRLMDEREDRTFHVEELEEVEDMEIARLTGKEWWQCHLGTVRQRMAVLHHHGRLSDVILVFPKYHVEMKVRTWC